MSKTRNPLTGTLSDREDPDEIPHIVAFHQCMYCWLRRILSPPKEIQFLEIIACDPSICISADDHPDFIVCINISHFGYCKGGTS